MLKAQKGTQVKVHYRGILTDGTEFDNSYNRGEPIEFQVGVGQMISGFDAAVVGMSVGDKKTITLTPNDAYGDINPEANTEIDRQAFPEGLELAEGLPVPLSTPEGHNLVGTISQLNETTVTVDLNHPLAGKNLQFDIEVIDIGEASTTSNEDG
jgi:peptidylprolyl isomerase